MDAMVEPLRASSEVDAAPDWSVVPFAVACARCGHDLHGRSEPTCPGCALTFRWADAVPIEQLTCTSCGYHVYGLTDTRCLECSGEFIWGDVLAECGVSRDFMVRGYVLTFLIKKSTPQGLTKPGNSLPLAKAGQQPGLQELVVVQIQEKLVPYSMRTLLIDGVPADSHRATGMRFGRFSPCTI